VLLGKQLILLCFVGGERPSCFHTNETNSDAGTAPAATDSKPADHRTVNYRPVKIGEMPFLRAGRTQFLKRFRDVKRGEGLKVSHLAIPRR
jgi:hypothetical protein